MRRFLLLLLFSFSAFVTSVFAQTVTTSVCNKAGLDVYQNDCLALISIYTNTEGFNWSKKANWGTSKVCTWQGVTCDISKQHVIGLDFTGVGLKGDFFITNPDVQYLDFLKTLTLSNNTITSFKSHGMPALETLKLDQNSLTNQFDFDTLSNLIELDLGWNKIYSFTVPKSSKLETLYLNDNNLISFTSDGPSTTLKNLYLNNNNLTSFEGALFPNLVILHIQNNKLTSFDGAQLHQLQSLDIRDNNLTELNFTGLASLKTIDADNNQISALNNLSALPLPVQMIHVGISNNKLTSPTPEVSQWLNSVPGTKDWRATQTTTTTTPSGSTTTPAVPSVNTPGVITISSSTT